MNEQHGSSLDLIPDEESPSEAGEALVAAAAERRRAARAAAPPPATRRRRRAAEAMAEREEEPASDETPAAPPTARRRKARRAKSEADAVQPASRRSATLDPVQGALRRLGPWGWAASAAMLAVAILAALALAWRPAPPRIEGIALDWMPGPRVADKEFLNWLRAFPHREQLPEANDWVLERLAEWLRAQPAIARVPRVRLVVKPDEASGVARRVVEISLALRHPEMPAVLASGERAWVDAEGVLLPGVLPAPTLRRPVVRGVETAGRPGLRAALAVWGLLEKDIEPGLVTDILLDEPLDERGSRGIVLKTRQGAALVWGRVDEERFGVRPEDKARELLRTLRAQGDLGRIAQVNVRFREPFFLLRGQP